MTTFKHIINQPFVAATGLAALIHSTWSLGTLFAGNQPSAENSLLAFLGWIIPALLIAFALDIGQIFTSVAIRERGLSLARGATFAIFAFATYYLQWLYMAHHMPALDLSAGVRSEWADSALLLRDAAIWIIPALLPLATLLYTFSDKAEATIVETELINETPVRPVANSKSMEEAAPEESSETETATDFLALPHHQATSKEKNANGAAWEFVHVPQGVDFAVNGAGKHHTESDNDGKTTNE